MNEQNKREFSETKHRSGLWNSSRGRINNTVLRYFVRLFSFKRALVTKTIAHLKEKSLVLDLGCGIGSYAYWTLGHGDYIVIGADWSYEALKHAKTSVKGSFYPVCADAQYLPFKSNSFNAVYSIDTLGHVEQPDKALGEIQRTGKESIKIGLHSECKDYQKRWPDSALIVALGKDVLAEYDGHYALRTTNEIRKAYSYYFECITFYSPVGFLGWILGYPDKYRIAFRQAQWKMLSLVVMVFAYVKRLPLLGILLRCVNVFSNRLEMIFFRNIGGGSCFAQLKNTKSKV